MALHGEDGGKGAGPLQLHSSCSPATEPPPTTINALATVMASWQGGEHLSTLQLWVTLLPSPLQA